MTSAANPALRDKVYAWAFIVTVAALPLVVNPFGPPAFGIPRLTWLRIGAAVLGVLVLFDLVDEGGARKVRSSAWLPLTAVTVSALLSTVFSVAPVTSLFGSYLRWEGLWTMACYWLIFVAAVRWGRNRTLFEWLWPSLLAGGALISILGILEFLGVVNLGEGMELFCAAGFGSSTAVTDRIVGTCGNAAFLGGYLAMIVCLALGISLAEDHGPGWWRPLAIGTGVLSAITLILTYARAAWLGAAFGVVAILVWRRPGWRTLATLGVALALAVALAAGAVAVAGRQSLVARVTGALAGGSAPQRLQIAKDTLPMIAGHAIIGVGLDAYGDVFARYQSLALLATGGGGNLKNDRAHNDLLQVAATQGLIGLAAWLWFLGAYAVAAATGLAKAPSGRAAATLLGAAAATIAYLVQAQFEFSTFVVAPLFWAMAGLVWSSASSYGHRPRPLLPRSLGRAALMSAVVAAVVSGFVAMSFWAADVAYNAGIAALYRRDAATAIADYRRAVAENPFEPLYRGSLGSALLSTSPRNPAAAAQQRAEAQAQFASADRLDPVATTADFLAGNAYVEFGARRGDRQMTGRAVTAYLRGLSHSPRSLDALTQLGRAYAFDGRWREALDTWGRAVAIMPDSPLLAAYEGRAYEKLGQRAFAIARYRAALTLDPTNRMATDGLKSLEGTAATR